MKSLSPFIILFVFCFLTVVCTYSAAQSTFPIVDTRQQLCFNNSSIIEVPLYGDPFFGQDAQFLGNQPSYTDNEDGTITDNITGLIWQKDYNIMSFTEAAEAVTSFNAGGYNDWRIPSIKEAYSLIIFSGKDVSSKEMNNTHYEAPFIDKHYFDFDYGSNGPRPIDVQVLTSTVYKGKTMGRDATVFGVNFADGRIKGYPIIDPRERSEKKFTVRFVRGNVDYGKNLFLDNNDGTISDIATGLMWQKMDSKTAMNWEEALTWAQEKNAETYLGHNDWRLPNIKELQSIVDYTRSPQETNSAAIDPIFEISKIKVEENLDNYPFFWSSTTHENIRGADAACYISFGEALGFFGPPHSSRKELMDVHGAGSQRSDPKNGNANEFPQGRGPQGDVIRIKNYVRLVRDIW